MSSKKLLKIEVDDRVATFTLDRPEKRNALSDELIAEIDAAFAGLSPAVKVVILAGSGEHFCSGIDLSELAVRSPEETLHHSRNWHRVMDNVQFGGLPVIAAMSGAVMGGGLELASATHIRIAEPDTIFQLPEGRRGIFVGGGATVRVGRILGADRMTEMMLTGRKYSAAEGLNLGLCHYNVETGQSLPLARELAQRVAENAPMSNYLMVNAISRIDDMSRSDGLFVESLSAGLSQSTPDAEEGVRAFLEKRSPKFR